MAQYHDELARVSLVWATDQTQWPNEIAVNTFHVHHHHQTGNTFAWSDALPRLADGVRDKLVSHWGAIGGMFGTPYRIVQVKAAQLDAQGHYQAEHVSVVNGTDLQGSAGSILPPETALVLSMFGYDPGSFIAHRGRARGRMYLPYLNTSLAGSSGKVRATIMADYLAGWQAFFNDVQGMHTDSAVGPNPDYWSVVIPSSVDGSMRQLRHLGYGDHFGSQRRRQHQTEELYNWVDISFSSADDS